MTSSAAAPADRAQPFQMRGSSFSLLALKLVEPQDPNFIRKLQGSVSLAPGFYRNAPVVLDLSDVAAQPVIDLVAFVDQLRALSLLPVGVQGASGDWERAAHAAHLPTFPAGRGSDPAIVRPANDSDQPGGASSGTGAAAQAQQTASSRPPGTGKVVGVPVRSGQQHYSPHGDLVITGTVGHGAELLADGNLHVYGVLRGRALAGLSGDVNARIFCRSLDAELIAIAGNYMVREQFGDAYVGKPVQIRLDGDNLVIEPV